MFLMIGVFVLLPVFLLARAPGPSNPTPTALVSVFPQVILYPFLIPLILYVLAPNLMLLGRRVLLYPDGVRLAGRFRSTFFPWADMVSVGYYMGFLLGGISRSGGRGRRTFSGKCVVRFRGGRTLTVTDYIRGHLDLFREIDAAFCRQKLPGALERVEQGGRVAFGPFSVAADGMSNGRETLPWRAIDRIDLVGLGMVEVLERGRAAPWSRVNVGKVPDIPLFFVLAGELRRRAALPRDEHASSDAAPRAAWQATSSDAGPSGAPSDRIEVRPPRTGPA
jgi:hypothetical protein